MTSRMTGPRREPTWTVPDGVLLSLTTCGPLTEAASSSAQSMVCLVSAVGLAARSARPGRRFGLADLRDRVGEVAGRDVDDDLVTLAPAEERAPDGRLVRDTAVRRLGLRRTDDRERL